MSGIRVTVQQPSYLPWLGYFEQMDAADAFFFYDDVQYTRRSWRSRNRIRLRDQAVYLTVPVANAHRPMPLIQDTIIADGPWRRKHLGTIELAYSKAPHYDETMAFLGEQLSVPTNNLSELNIHLTTAIARWIGIETPLGRTADLDYERTKGQERMLNICRAVGADRHYTGQGARNLLDSRYLADGGLTVEYHVFRHPEYPQSNPPFMSHLAVVDALFWVGHEDLLALIRAGRRPPEVEP